jgi:uncharacterized protein involved in exopolysaccharide biosynthesis/beta-lactamase regulating signal transducer with metallopeptidase domain
MNTTLTGLPSTLAERVGLMLLHSLWQSALIGCAFAVVQAALRRYSANARYLAGCVGMALLLIAPVITLVVGDIPVPNARGGASFAAIGGLVKAPSVPMAEAPNAKVENNNYSWLRWLEDLFRWLAPNLAAVWLLGVGVFSIRLMGSWWWTRSLRTIEGGMLEPGWIETLNDLRCRLEISRPVRLLQSTLVEVPTVIGWLRPVILLPAASLAGLSPAQLEAIIAHELAHVRRFDYVVNACQCLIETLLFFNPITWWISRCVREERENCCDDLVITVCGNRVAYASALTALEEARADLPQLAFAATGGSLLNRIRRLASTQEPGGPTTARHVGGLALLGTGMSLVILGIYLNLAPSMYRASARIKLDAGSLGLIRAKHGPETSAYDPYFIQTQFAIITSEPVLGKVIDNLNLTAAWSKKYSAGQRLEPSKILALLRARIDLRMLRSTTLLDIRALSDEPQEAANIANAIADAYRAHLLAQIQDAGIRAIQPLEDQWLQQEKRIQAARKQVEDLRIELQIPDEVANQAASESDGENPLAPLVRKEKLRKINDLRIETSAELVRQESLLDRLKELSLEQFTQVIPTTIQDSLLTSMLEQRNTAEQRLVGNNHEFGSDHPETIKIRYQIEDLQGKIKLRKDGIILGLSTKVDSLRDELKHLERAAADAGQEEFATVNQSRPYFEAKRKLEELQNFGRILNMKIAAEKIDQSLPGTSVVEIVDPAVPSQRPVSPNRYAGTAWIFLGLLLDVAGFRILKSKKTVKT